MDICRAGRGNAETAQGIVVAIDVIRAFSVAAYAFNNGAGALWLVHTIEGCIRFAARRRGDCTRFWTTINRRGQRPARYVCDGGERQHWQDVEFVEVRKWEGDPLHHL